MKYLLLLSLMCVFLIPVSAEEGFHATLRPGNTIEVSATADSYYRLPIANTVRLQPSGKNITITVTKDYLFIDAPGYAARTKETLVINDHDLHVLTDTGSLSISAFPDTLADKIKAEYPDASVFESELKAQDGRVVYAVPAKLPTKVFGIFPYHPLISIEADAETGMITLPKLPWYLWIS